MALRFNEFIDDSIEFNYFELYVRNQLYGDSFEINEFIVPFMNKIKDAWEFIKSLAKVVGFGLIEIAKLFLNKVVYNIFKAIGFSLTKIFNVVKSGYKLYIEFRDSIAKYIAQTKLVKNVSEYSKWLDEFLNKHPFLKKLSGLALAGLLLYIWLNLISFTGDPEFDFNINDMWGAISGKVGFVDVFGGENGVKLITFIATNQLFGLTFPYPGESSVQFMGAIIYTLLRAIGKKFIWKPVNQLKIEKN